MKGYLTIGDFAKLHNVNQKSLRYYERIGALEPAYIDPATGYRYYALEQLVELDMILMCLELNIPLKEAEQYRNPDHTLDIQRLLQDGRQKALEKMERLQDILTQMKDALGRVEAGESCQGQAGPYRRQLGPRLILRETFDPSGGALGFKQASARIFLHGQTLGLLPAFTFPIGLIAERDGSGFRTDIFLEVLRQKEGVDRLDTLSEGEYLCRQEPAAELEHTEQLIGDYFSQHPDARRLVITNLTSAHFDPKGLVLELQQPLFT